MDYLRQALEERKNDKRVTPLIKGRKPIILCDQDDVLARYCKRVMEKYNKKFNTNHTVDELDDWEAVKKFGDDMMEIMCEPSIYLELEPIIDGINTLKHLIESDMFDVYIVTAAHASGCENKYHWIKEHMDFFNTDHIIYAKKKGLIMGDLLIDDAIHNVVDFTKLPGRDALLVDMPHNQKFVDNDHVKRVKDWNTIGQYILDKFYPIDEK